MERILAQWRILGASLISVLLVGGVYLLARDAEHPRTVSASAETELLKAIAGKDTDGDGLPDWEEALYGADPHLVDSFGLGMPDGEAVTRGLVVPKAIADLPVQTTTSETSVDDSLPPPPEAGTMTAAFTKNFLTLYVAAREQNGGQDLSEAQVQSLVQETVRTLSSSVSATPDFISIGDLSISGSGNDALIDFAVRAEAVLQKNTNTASDSELAYLQKAVVEKDADAPLQIASIAKSYRDSALGLAHLTVPEELADTHLALTNALMRLAGITSDFAGAERDPLAAMLALEQYPDAVLAVANAFIEVSSVYRDADITLPTGAPGASFVNLIANTVDLQATQTP